MKCECECGQHLKTYVVVVDGEQYIENLCPMCAFPNLADPADPGDYNFADTDSNRTLTLEMIDTTMAQLRAQGKIGKTLITSPRTLTELSKLVNPISPTVGANIMRIPTSNHTLDVKSTYALRDGDAAIICDSDPMMAEWHPVGYPVGDSSYVRIGVGDEE